VPSFDEVWSRIRGCAGQEFHTKTGVKFTYRVEGAAVIPDHTGYPIHVSQFQKAYALMPLRGPSELNRLVRGPAYVYALLTDVRTRHGWKPAGDP
jgi:hypothetical protein